MKTLCLLTVFTLETKFQRAKQNIEKTSVAYNGLTATLNRDSVEIWKAEAAKARVERGEILRVYDINLAEGMWNFFCIMYDHCEILTWGGLHSAITS